MKILFDEQLSFKLVRKLQDIFPGSKHVKDLSLEREDDFKIWDFARKNDFVIATKDSDFIDIANVQGHPPFVIWLRTGNVSVIETEKHIRHNAIKILNVYRRRTIGIVQLR